MNPAGLKWFAGTLLALALFCNAYSPIQAAPQKSARSQVATKQTAAVEGFRSARFGMTEKQVYKAIYNDFKITKKNVARHRHPLEKTLSLEIAVKDLLPDSGPARAFYVFGYKSNRLIQVNILWGQPAGSAARPERVVDTANQLRNYFSRQGFPKESQVVNTPAGKELIIVFRARDRAGRMVLLLMTNPPKQKTRPAPLSLKLSYIQKPERPDVFKIKPGQF